ncbi:MAG TPA: DUF4783 domain-containing protein [Ignavibacteriales bacterium]|nr:DUF4783 domain-containing protein [Ignavibacteriales bacterium]
MKKLFLLFLFLSLPVIIHAQSFFVPSDVQISLDRITNAFRAGNPKAMDDLLSSPVTMRLQDSLYRDISNIQASDLLQSFFSDKKVIDFRFSTPGNGKLIYEEAGKRDTVNVDIWMRRALGGPVLHEINISNYPIATVFFNIHHDDKK